MSRESRRFGHVPGVRFGDTFKNRKELVKAGVHAQSRAGIHGDSKEGAFSICLSEGYEDNEDKGDVIIYVGSGGRNARRKQTKNQSFDDSRNKSLQVSSVTGNPVRVVRGKNENSYYATVSGYRFDGLYVVDSAEMRTGKQGYQMCSYKLTRVEEEGDGPLPTKALLTPKKLTKMNREAQRK